MEVIRRSRGSHPSKPGDENDDCSSEKKNTRTRPPIPPNQQSTAPQI
jgi:hypothetical protein